MTPLFNACYRGHINIVKYLIEQEVDINKKVTMVIPLYIMLVEKETKTS